MTNSTSRSVRSALIAGGLLLACLLMLRCQEADEPLGLTIPANIRFQICDSNQRALQSVLLAATPLESPSELLSFTQVTDNAGECLVTGLPMPIQGSHLYRLVLTIPDVGSVTDTISIPCRDTTFKLRIDIPSRFPCAGIKQDTILLEACLDDVNSALIERCGNSLFTDCGGAVTLTLDRSGLSAPGLSINIVDPATKSEVNPVAPRQPFCILYSYNVADGPLVAEGTIVIRASDASGQVTGECHILVRVEYNNCVDCECPEDLPLLVTQQVPDSICVGDELEVEFDLGKVRHNSDQECVLQFDQIKAFNNQIVFQVVSAPQNVVGGNFIPSVIINFSPDQPGPFSDTTVFSVTRRNSATGEVVECEPLTVIYNGFAQRPQCELAVVEPRNTAYVNTDSTFQICLNSVRTKFLRVRNTGPCEIEINSEMLFNLGQFDVNPERQTIQPNDFAEFNIVFAAGARDVWPTGRGGVPGQTRFGDIVRLSGGGCDTTFNLIGDVDTTCQSNLYVCIHELGITDSYFESIRINENRTIEYVNDPINKDTFDIFATSVNSGPGRVTLSAAGFRNVVFRLIARDHNVPSTSDICETFPQAPNLVDQDTQAECQKGSSVGAQTLPDLRVNDVVMFFKDGECGLIYILAIGPDRDDADNLLNVCVQICYPLVF